MVDSLPNSYFFLSFFIIETCFCSFTPISTMELRQRWPHPQLRGQCWLVSLKCQDLFHSPAIHWEVSTSPPPGQWEVKESYWGNSGKDFLWFEGTPLSEVPYLPLDIVVTEYAAHSSQSDHEGSWLQSKKHTESDRTKTKKLRFPDDIIKLWNKHTSNSPVLIQVLWEMLRQDETFKDF